MGEECKKVVVKVIVPPGVDVVVKTCGGEAEAEPAAPSGDPPAPAGEQPAA